MAKSQTSKNFTAAFVSGVKNEPGKEVTYQDLGQPGLCLRITKSGSKSWTFRYRNLAGQQRRITLGKVDDIGLKEARSLVAGHRAEIAKGIDPSLEAANARLEAQQAAKQETLAEVGEWYYQECNAGRQTPNARNPKRPSTLRVERPYFDNMILPKLGKLKVRDITRQQVEIFINNLIDNQSPSAGRHCRVILHSIFEFSIWKEIADKNPCKFLSKPPIKSRDIVISDEYLKTIWETFTLPTEGLSVSPSLCYAIKLVMITIQRRGEIAGMQENEIDFETRIWTIPGDRTKNHRTHLVPLSDLAIELIRHAIALKEKPESRFVFPSPRSSKDNDKSIDGQAITHAFTRARTVFKWPDIRIHDLRRTGATNLTSERLRFPRFTVSKVLNHASDTGGASVTTGVYDRNEYLPEKRKALDAWANRLTEIVEGQEMPDNVITINALNR